jgi:hypothetical protein
LQSEFHPLFSNPGALHGLSVALRSLGDGYANRPLEKP